MENKRKRTKFGIFDIYPSRDGSSFTIAKLRKMRIGGGYCFVRTFPSRFDVKKSFGYNDETDFIVAQEPLVFDRLSYNANAVYKGQNSGGEAVLSADKIGLVLSVSPELNVSFLDI